MARSDRQQRRQRRAQQQPALAGGPPVRPPARPVAQGDDEPRRDPEPRPERPERARSGIPLVGFVQEAIAELKKVEWPGQNQVIQGTMVVLIACVIVGTFLWLNDQIWQEVVKKVLL